MKNKISLLDEQMIAALKKPALDPNEFFDVDDRIELINALKACKDVEQGVTA